MLLVAVQQSLGSCHVIGQFIGIDQSLHLRHPAGQIPEVCGEPLQPETWTQRSDRSTPQAKPFIHKKVEAEQEGKPVFSCYFYLYESLRRAWRSAARVRICSQLVTSSSFFRWIWEALGGWVCCRRSASPPKVLTWFRQKHQISDGSVRTPGDSVEWQVSCLVLQSSQVSLQTLVFPQQSLNTGQVPAKVIRGHQLLLLLDPADGFIHVPTEKPTGPSEPGQTDRFNQKLKVLSHLLKRWTSADPNSLACLC